MHCHRNCDYLEGRGNTILATHLHVQTPLGRRIIDIVIRMPTGRIVAYEVKANSADRSNYQMTQDQYLRVFGGEVRTYGNDFFPRGSDIQILTGQLNVTCLTGCE